jgi:hypothetical protein
MILTLNDRDCVFQFANRCQLVLQSAEGVFVFVDINCVAHLC